MLWRAIKKRAGDAIKFIVSSDIGQSKIKLITLAQIGEILATYSEICPESAAISHRGAPLICTYEIGYLLHLLSLICTERL